MHRVALLVVLCSLCVVNIASAQTVTGNMDATMKRGDTQTLTATLDFSNRSYSGHLIVLVTAGRDLTLGKTTISTPFNCLETPNFNDCEADVSITAGQKITMTQVLTVRDDAFHSSASWTIELIGDGLSGAVPRTGVITIPDGGPKIVVSRAASGILLVKPVAADQNADSFDLTNIGTSPGFVSIRTSAACVQPGAGLSSPLLLAPNETQTVNVTVPLGDSGGCGFPVGYLIVLMNLSGDGVTPGAFVPIRIVVTRSRPDSQPNPKPEKNRLDVSGPAAGPNPTGIITFTNAGPGSANGLLSSDSPWIIFPTDASFSLEPGESRVANFTVDTAQQATAGSSSNTGTVTFRYFLPTSSKSGANRVAPLGDPPGTGSVSVTLVSTVTPAASTATIPPLSGIHEQLFLAGVGHAQGSVGLFISDLAIYPQVMRSSANFRSLAVADVDMYYTPLGGGATSKTTVASLAPPNVAAFGDFVGTVYGATGQVGSLQIRTPGFQAGEGALGVNANVFNVSGKAGTYGTTIPVFKFGAFECTQDANKKLYLTGLRKDSSGHTNFYVQETCGSAARVTLDFYDPSGTKIGSTTNDVPPFAAIQLGSSVIPTGAVSAVLSHAPGTGGGFVAYATPVDDASGDTWAQVDWPNQRGYSGNAAVIIPVAGATPGANNTYFRTDLSIMNTGNTAGTGTLRFYNRTGDIIDKTINVGALQTNTYVDVTTTLFGITTPHVGYFVFTPASGTFVLTSRNYSTAVGSNATFGTAVPTLALTAAMFPPRTAGSLQIAGDVRRIGGVEDASPDTITSARAATFRSNFGLIETSGQPATVKVTVYYNYSSSLTSTVNGASTTINLSPNQFLLQGLGSTVFGANRSSFGDLHNVTVEFEVIGGTGKVLPFISSVDNGTGDSTFRTE